MSGIDSDTSSCSDSECYSYSSSTNTSCYRLDVKLESYRNILSSPQANIIKLRDEAWNGIPFHHRTPVWQALCGYLSSNSKRRRSNLQRKRRAYYEFAFRTFDDSNDKDHVLLRQIQMDIPRATPWIPQVFSQDHRVKNCLERLLYTWAVRHPASSYVQGMNDLAILLLAVFIQDRVNQDHLEDSYDFEEENLTLDLEEADSEELNQQHLEMGLDLMSDEDFHAIEADTYWCFTNILSTIQDHYTPDQPGIQEMVHKLELIMEKVNPKLCHHLKSNGVVFLHFAFRWMNCLLVREMPLHLIIRIWDTYLSEIDTGGFHDFHVNVCAALLNKISEKIFAARDFEGIMCLLQNLPTQDWVVDDIEMLLSQAYVYRNIVHVDMEAKRLSFRTSFSESLESKNKNEAKLSSMIRKSSYFSSVFVGDSNMWTNDVGYLCS